MDIAPLPKASINMTSTNISDIPDHEEHPSRAESSSPFINKATKRDPKANVEETTSKTDDNPSPEAENSPSSTEKLAVTPVEELHHLGHMAGYKDIYCAEARSSVRLSQEAEKGDVRDINDGDVHASSNSSSQSQEVRKVSFAPDIEDVEVQGSSTVTTTSHTQQNQDRQEVDPPDDIRDSPDQGEPTSQSMIPSDERSCINQDAAPDASSAQSKNLPSAEPNENNQVALRAPTPDD